MSDLRGRIEQVLREHLLENARCITCGERATYQSVHQADVLLAVLRPDIDTVTRAICQAMYPHEPPYENQLRMQHDSTGYRRMARAAVDSWIGQP